MAAADCAMRLATHSGGHISCESLTIVSHTGVWSSWARTNWYRSQRVPAWPEIQNWPGRHASHFLRLPDTHLLSPSQICSATA